MDADRFKGFLIALMVVGLAVIIGQAVIDCSGKIRSGDGPALFSK